MSNPPPASRPNLSRTPCAAVDAAAGQGLLIHVGYPKTASTWLQHHVFANEALGFTAPWEPRAGLAIEQFVLSNDYTFDPDATANRFTPTIREAVAGGRVPVLSEEMLICDPCAGKYWGPRVMEKIHAALPAAHVLLCIREQKQYIRAAFGEYVKTGGMQTLDEFMGATPRRPGVGPVCQVDYLRFDRAIRHLQALFGKDRVLVLPMEWLRQSQRTFLEPLLRFAGIEREVPDLPNKASNRGFAPGGLSTFRRLNRMCPHWFSVFGKHRLSRAVDWVLPSSTNRRLVVDMQERIERYVGTQFRESNRQVQALTGLDLESLGYDC